MGINEMIHGDRYFYKHKLYTVRISVSRKNVLKIFITIFEISTIKYLDNKIPFYNCIKIKYDEII